jgi:hypothetical protein
MTRWQKSIEEGRSCRNLSRKEDPAVESSGELTDEEHIEEIFEQLWATPSPVKPRVAAPAVWIRKDLAKERQIRPEDCFPAGRNL